MENQKNDNLNLLEAVVQMNLSAKNYALAAEKKSEKRS